MHRFRLKGIIDLVGKQSVWYYTFIIDTYTTWQFQICLRLVIKRRFRPRQVGKILSWRLIMKYFLQSFSPFSWFKKGSCQLWFSGLWFFKFACAVPYLGYRHEVFPWNYLKVSTTMPVNSKGSGKTVLMRRLTWVFAGCLCNKYPFLICWLIWFTYNICTQNVKMFWLFSILVLKFEGLHSSEECSSDWWSGRRFDPYWVWQYSFAEIDHEIFFNSQSVLSADLRSCQFLAKECAQVLVYCLEY